MANVPDAAILQFKTAAWASPEMVRTYAATMDKRNHAFKTAVEVEAMQRFTIGRDILDVGTGTGRIAITLARQRYRVVAVDSSAAMLEHTRTNAGGTPIDLRVGDINQLPVESSSFDTLLSLNCAVHFPNWKQYLLEWKRVVRSGGRLIFDVGSMDHIDAVGQTRGKSSAELLAAEGTVTAFYMRLRWLDMLDFCNENGFRLVAIIPLGMTFGSGVRWQWYGGMACDVRWERIREALACDNRLFAFAKFIEQDLVGVLTPHATGSMIIVLENVADVAGNEQFRDRMHKLTELLSQRPRLAQLAPYLRCDLMTWKNELAYHLQHVPNRVFAFMLLTGLPDQWFHSELLDELGGPELASLWRDWLTLREIDSAVESCGRSWYAGVSERFYDGVDIGSITQYAFTERLISLSRDLRTESLR